MKVSHYFTASLTAPTPAVLYAVKGDGARMAVARLMAGAEAWTVPEGVTAGISYTLPDKTPGYYDRLEDGTPACMIAGNLVSAVIAPVLTGQPGAVKASIVLRDADGGQVATFPFQLRVEPAPGIVDAESVPAMGNGFEGKLFYGGPGGALTALALGDGVRVETTEDGTLALVAEGGSGGGGGITEEKDPTVPAWAKQPQKPAYTAQEVGALPQGTKIPGKTSDLTNDSGFVDKAVNDLANYYTKTQMQELIAEIPRFRVTVVQQLPAAGEELTLYLVPFATAEGQYLEYIWVDGRWEIIGSQRVDLTGYATEEWVQEYVEEHSGQNVELDTTLTQSGKAADAKAVGDALDKLEEKIPSIEGLAKTEDIPNVPNWAMQPSKPSYAASEVGADPKGTAATAVSGHNTATDSHGDIRQELAAINARLTAFFDSDNQTLDELSEIVAYITSNKSLIDAITTSKVSVSDIINNLTTNVANKPLSAAQGVAIKALIDNLSASLTNYQPKGDYALVSAVPTKVSQLANDKGYLTEHQDISGKADKNQVATYITPEQYGAKGDGSTDDSAAIQAAIDAAGSENIVYLAKKTYKISAGLNINHSNRKFVCEGTLLYDGTDVAVSITSKYINVSINKIDAVNGTAIKLDATAKYVEYCVVNVDYILNSVIGIHLYTNGSPMCYNRFYNKGIVASEIGVFVDCNANYITENWWWLGRIYGSPNKGIYLKNAGRNMFCSGGLEGISETGCAIYLENSEHNSFMDLRCSEYYGAKSIVFSGKCTANSLWLSRICLDEVDISELEQSAQAEQFSNVLRSVKLIDSQANWNSLGNEAWVSYRRKITYNPKFKNFRVNAGESVYPDRIIQQIGADIPTEIVFDAEATNGKTFKLSDIYNKDDSLAKGFQITIKFGTDGGKVLLTDSDNNAVLDNTNGKYAGKTVSARWNGLNPETNQDIWDIKIVGATYATEDYVLDYAQPKGNYLTKVPSGYATEEYVKNKIAEAELSGKEVDLSGYAQKTELPTKVSQLENDAGYLTEHQSLAEYAKKTDIPAVPTKVSQLQNDAGYLTQHQDISGKADKSSAETWTFTLADGSTVAKKVVLA